MGIPLTDIGHEREQGDVAGALDGHRELPLVGGAGARDPPRQDPPTLRHEAPETSDILVVNLLHLVHAELADLLPTIALPSLDHRHWSLPMFGPIVDSRTVPTLCFNLLQLPCRTRPQPSQQAGWSHAAHQVGTALERRLVLCRGRRRLCAPRGTGRGLPPLRASTASALRASPTSAGSGAPRSRPLSLFSNTLCTSRLASPRRRW